MQLKNEKDQRQKMIDRAISDFEARNAELEKQNKMLLTKVKSLEA
jgi:hypothetical protein